MSKWSELFSSGALERLGEGCRNLAEFAERLGVEPGPLDTAFRRHRARLKLRPTLASYIDGPAAPVQKKPRVKLSDLRFPLSDERKEAIASARRVVVTSALNNSGYSRRYWDALLRYCKANKAELVVLPVRYKNPTNRVDGKIIDDRAWWHPDLVPYMTDDFIELHEHVWIMGHVRIQATATHPLTGLDTISRGASAVFGHGQLSMRMVPTPHNKLPKVLYSTGSVSLPNYSETKAGIKGEFHHATSAIVVEIDGPRFHVRELSADDSGGFYDLDTYYGPEKIYRRQHVAALITGDEHVIFSDPACRAATYESKDSIAKTLRPEYIVRHDVGDMYSIGHHGRKSPAKQIAKHLAGEASLEEELGDVADHIDATTSKGATNLVVSSNHHDHLMRWLNETTMLDEPWNAKLWHKLWGLVLDTMEMGPGGARYGDPFALYLQDRVKAPTEFLPPDSDRTICGIAVGFHGHHGLNGARGSIRAYGKIGIKSVIGHSHTPGICHGVYQVGTSSQLKLEYTHGPSSWAHCHCIIHHNGRRQLVFVVDGHWRAPK